MTVLTKKSKLPQNHSENSDKAHESSVSGFETTPKKTSKCYCVFHPEWLTEDGLLWLGKIDESTANCTSAVSHFLSSMRVNMQLLLMLNQQNIKILHHRNKVRLFQIFL